MFKRKDQALMRCPTASVYIFSAYKCIDNPMLIFWKYLVFWKYFVYSDSTN